MYEYVLVKVLFSAGDVHWIYVASLLLQNATVSALSAVRQAIVQLTSNPADFDEVMFSLVTTLTDKLSDNSIVEAIVEDLFRQVCMCSFAFSALTRGLQ